MGEQQEAGQAAFLNRKRLTWMARLIVQHARGPVALTILYVGKYFVGRKLS
jgi:hypothetical protein